MFNTSMKYQVIFILAGVTTQTTLSFLAAMIAGVPLHVFFVSGPVWVRICIGLLSIFVGWVLAERLVAYDRSRKDDKK